LFGHGIDLGLAGFHNGHSGNEANGYWLVTLVAGKYPFAYVYNQNKISYRCSDFHFVDQHSNSGASGDSYFLPNGIFLSLPNPSVASAAFYMPIPHGIQYI
jgi:membrane-bound inhibitor of C-type lysozyme